MPATVAAIVVSWNTRQLLAESLESIAATADGIDVETVVVTSMHERKMMMFERSDAFVVLPGGIGTLEEIVELLSWQRLGLHQKPVVFYNPRGFWDPLFELFHHTIRERLSPPEFAESWRSVDRVEDVIPALRSFSVVRDADAVHPDTARST